MEKRVLIILLLGVLLVSSFGFVSSASYEYKYCSPEDCSGYDFGLKKIESDSCMYPPSGGSFESFSSSHIKKFKEEPEEGYYLTNNFEVVKGKDVLIGGILYVEEKIDSFQIKQMNNGYLEAFLYEVDEDYEIKHEENPDVYLEKEVEDGGEGIDNSEVISPGVYYLDMLASTELSTSVYDCGTGSNERSVGIGFSGDDKQFMVARKVLTREELDSYFGEGAGEEFLIMQCGEDNYKSKICSEDSGCNSDSNDKACCDSSRYCVNEGVCYSSGTKATIDGSDVYCHGAVWALDDSCPDGKCYYDGGCYSKFDVDSDGHEEVCGGNRFVDCEEDSDCGANQFCENYKCYDEGLCAGTLVQGQECDCGDTDSYYCCEDEEICTYESGECMLNVNTCGELSNPDVCDVYDECSWVECTSSDTSNCGSGETCINNICTTSSPDAFWANPDTMDSIDNLENQGREEIPIKTFLSDSSLKSSREFEFCSGEVDAKFGAYTCAISGVDACNNKDGCIWISEENYCSYKSCGEILDESECNGANWCEYNTGKQECVAASCDGFGESECLYNMCDANYETTSPDAFWANPDTMDSIDNLENQGREEIPIKTFLSDSSLKSSREFEFCSGEVDAKFGAYTCAISGVDACNNKDGCIWISEENYCSYKSCGEILDESECNGANWCEYNTGKQECVAASCDGFGESECLYNMCDANYETTNKQFKIYRKSGGLFSSYSLYDTIEGEIKDGSVSADYLISNGGKYKFYVKDSSEDEQESPVLDVEYGLDPCTIESVEWGTNPAIAGNEIELIINGNDKCNGMSAFATIFEKDGTNDCGGGGDDFIKSYNQDDGFTFDGNSATLTWNVANPSNDDEEPKGYCFISMGEESELLSVEDESVVCAGINYCSDHTIEETCNANNCGEGKNSVEQNTPGITCGEDGVSCSCFWNESLSECSPKYEVMDEGGEALGTCTYNENSDDTCEDDGKLTYSWDAIWNWNEEATPNPTNENYLACKSGESSHVCPAQVELPFFNWISLIATIGVILIVYVLLKKDKDKNLKIKKK